MKKIISFMLAFVMMLSIAVPTNLVIANATTDAVMQSWSSKITTASELANRAKYVAQNVKTLYVMGCFGAPMTQTNKDRYCNNHDYNKNSERTAMIQAASSDTFGFDCVCLIKGLLWGWCGDASKVYGGATYASNNVPDIAADQMIDVCSEVSTDFTDIEVGELLWMPGHVGLYIGDGLAVECTPNWENCVQITSCNRYIAGYNQRNWSKHGKLPYVEYQMILDVNMELIKLVGHQDLSGDACSCFAMAYARTITDKKVHYFYEYNVYGDNQYSVYCDWGEGLYYGHGVETEKEAYFELYNAITKGKPAIAQVNGSPQHYVTVVGLENVVSIDSLGPDNFLILDPAGSSFEIVNMANAGYRLNRFNSTDGSNNHYQVVLPYDSVPKVEFGSGGKPSQNGIDVGTDFNAYIINTNHWMHLTNDDGNVTLRSETGAYNQIWHFERLGDGSYKITSLYDGTCLDVDGAGTIEGTNVGTYTDNGTAAQRWYINGYSGAYTFKAQCANTVMDVKDNSNQEGANIQMWTSNGSSAQLFQVWKVETHKHSYSSYTVAPTCNEEGYTAYTCSGCGHSYYTDYKSALGHYYSKWYEVYAPSCSSDGLYQSVCSTCGHVKYLSETAQSVRTLWVTGINLYNDNIQKTELEGMGVVYTRPYSGGYWWIHVAFAPTGYGTYRVGDIADGIPNGGGYALDIPEGGFVWAANYGNDYYSLGLGDVDYKNPGANECIALAKTWEIGDEFIIDNVDFEYETVSTSTPGLKWYDDNYECLSRVVQIMYADSLGHDYYSATVYPTCTSQGYTKFTCRNCGNTYNSNYVSANGHSCGNWYTVTHATCTASGSEKRDCYYCSYSETRNTEAIGHTYGEWTTVIEPAIGKEGRQEQRCSDCGMLLNSKVLPAIPLEDSMLGDINGNGEIEKYDYIAVKRAVMGTYDLSGSQKSCADINGNGEVEKYDYILIKRHVMGTFTITK